MEVVPGQVCAAANVTRACRSVADVVPAGVTDIPATRIRATGVTCSWREAFLAGSSLTSATGRLTRRATGSKRSASRVGPAMPRGFGERTVCMSGTDRVSWTGMRGHGRWRSRPPRGTGEGCRTQEAPKGERSPRRGPGRAFLRGSPRRRAGWTARPSRIPPPGERDGPARTALASAERLRPRVARRPMRAPTPRSTRAPLVAAG